MCVKRIIMYEIVRTVSFKKSNFAVTEEYVVHRGNIDSPETGKNHV